MRREGASEEATPRPGRAPSALAPSTLHGRINRLFEVNHHPDEPEREYRNREVVDACRAAGRDLSESHLSELRRGIKTNPSDRTLETLAWFFGVRVEYLTFADPAFAAGVEVELGVRAAKLQARLKADRDAREDLAAAARELQRAIRQSGVAKMAHRSTAKGMDARQQAAMMRALTEVILADEAEED